MKRNNTKPKGATSYKKTAFGIIPRTKLLKLELEGTKKGYEYIHSLVVKNKHIFINPELIRKLHEVSFGWIFPEWAGKFRTVQVIFSDKEAVPYYQVPEHIQNLCDDLQVRLENLPQSATDNYIISVIELLAWFQHTFVFIHPFQDYNGRVARMLTTLILLTLSLPPMELKAETVADRKRYISALQSADSGNYLPLEELIGDSLSEALDTKHTS